MVESNTDIGNVSLTVNDILPIIQTTSADNITLAGSDILVLDCDLGAQIKIDEIRYYFNSASASGTVASGIEFYYKYDDVDSYSPLTTSISTNYYYTTITSGTSAPRYVRIKHTVDGTSVSGTVAGFEITNDDSIVDFGDDATDEFINMELSLLYDTEDINPIEIYNSGTVRSTAHIILEPQGTVADEVLSIATSTDGPWYGAKQTDNEIAGPTNWEYGLMNNTEITSNQLRITAGNHFGTFTTRVFDTIDKQKFTYLNLDVEYPSSSGIVAVDDIDTAETIEMRSSNRVPEDYITYRKIKFLDAKVKYVDYWLYDDSIKFTSPDIDNYSGDVKTATFDTRSRMTIDLYTGRAVMVFRYDPTALVTDRATLVRTDYDGNSEAAYHFVTNGQTNQMQVYALKMDVNGGCWIYIYNANSTGWFDQGAGFYLAYFDSNFTEQYKLFDNSGFMYDMDVVYDTGDLWYTNKELNSVIKLNTDGEITGSMSLTSDAKGVVAERDGSCWVIQGAKVVHINSSVSEVISEVDLSDTAIGLSRIALDGENALWLTDSHYVRRVFKTGGVDFSVDVGTQSMELKSYESGVAVNCVNRDWKFVSRVNKRVIKTIENTSGLDIDIGVTGVIYSNTFYSGQFPVPVDSYWYNLEWRKVLLNHYNIAEEKYNQIRLTLRDDGNFVSPLVNGLYLNESIIVEDIYPNQYATIYLKADVSEQSSSGDFSSNLKTWWYLVN